MALFLLFLLVPIVEIALFIQVGGWLGLWPTLLIVVLTAIAGTILVRTQGLQTIRRLQTNLEAGRDPVGPIAHGALILVSGVLLLTPGFFTDAVALALMVPAVRGAVIRWGASRVTVIAAGRMQRGPQPQTQERRTHGPETVEAEYEVLEESEVGQAKEAPRRANGSNWTGPPR